jgi:N6-adenosine-specific RNA methylase IME4
MSDDEWKHETWSEQGQDRAADTHYSTSEAETLINRQLAAAEHAVYYMWSIVPHQPLAFEVMKARGFTYRSQISWWKIYPGNKPGLGYWSRIEHELLLIGTRGDIACPAPGDNWRSVQLSFAGEHSTKPEWCYRMIEAYHPGLIGTMIEYNARKRRRGWSAWGNEIGLVEPSPAELLTEFEAAPLLPDPDYIDVDRAWFHAMRPKLAGGVTMTLTPGARPLSARGKQAVAALAEAAAKAIENLPPEDAPESPDLRALWLIEAGRVGEVAAPDLKRVIAAGYATPGRANRKKGDARPALISAHGAAELKAWRQRVADEAAFEAGDVTAEAVRGEEFFTAEADRRGIPTAKTAAPPSVAGPVVEGFTPPKFLLADSAERVEADRKRDAKRGVQ